MSIVKKIDGLRTDRFAAVILAAGYSSRMKAFKPLLDVGGAAAVQRLIQAVENAGIKKITVVTGYNRERLSFVFDGGVVEVYEAYNENFSEGMFSSVRTGLAAAVKKWDDIEGVLLMPVDCPLISSDVIETLIRRAQDGAELNGENENIDFSEGFYVPVFEGKKGHPLLIRPSYIKEICEYGGSGGLKAITDKYSERMVRVPVTEEGCVMDMDTPQGYADINAFLESGCRRTSLDELAAGRRIFLIRHGETVQHDEKMFIGRYDVPLADEAEGDVRKMAVRLGEELARPERQAACAVGAARRPIDINRIYTSPLVRAMRTAEIIKSELSCMRDAELCIVRDFQEISLGKWDGRPVREIQEDYPEEYERRGRDFFAFKLGGGAENFYDVQYRAVTAMRRILETDSSRDIVIVTHSAVIRALQNNLKSLRIDDDWNPIRKGEFVKVVK